MTGRILTPGAVIAGMEICWLYALLNLLRIKIGVHFPEAGILCFYPLSYAYHAWIPWTRRRWLLRELTGWLIWAVVLIGWASFVHAGGWGAQAHSAIPASPYPGVFLTTALSGAFWFMGHRLGNRRPGFSLCLGEFQFGIAALIIIYFVYAQLSVPLAPLLPVTVTFFILGLTGLLLARADEGTHASQEHRRGWRFGILAGSLILILAIAFWIFSVIKVGLLAWILSTLTDAGQFVARMIASFFDFLAGLFPEGKLQPVQIKEPRLLRQEDAPLPVPIPISGIVLWIGRFILFLGWLALILLALWTISENILKWLRGRMALSEGVEEESLRGAFREDLKRLLRAIFGRIAAVIERFRLRMERRPLDPGIAGVRQAYRRLLALAAAGGCVRKPARTPHEHLAALTSWLPEASGEFAYITGQYVAARYGPGPVGEEILRELTFSLKKIRRFRRRKRVRVPFKKIWQGLTAAGMRSGGTA
jgi:hypothetical protein